MIYLYLYLKRHLESFVEKLRAILGSRVLSCYIIQGGGSKGFTAASSGLQNLTFLIRNEHGMAYDVSSKCEK